MLSALVLGLQNFLQKIHGKCSVKENERNPNVHKEWDTFLDSQRWNSILDANIDCSIERNRAKLAGKIEFRKEILTLNLGKINKFFFIKNIKVTYDNWIKSSKVRRWIIR